MSGSVTGHAAAAALGPIEPALAHARGLFLDSRHTHGCAETVFVVLKTAWGLDDASDSTLAMALNGGIAYTGGPCGAVTGAALAVGLLAGRRSRARATAKRVARLLVADTVAAFRQEFGAVDCRDLIGIQLDAPGAHDAFLRGDVWVSRCMPQIEFVVRRLAPLGDEACWDAAVRRLTMEGSR